MPSTANPPESPHDPPDRTNNCAALAFADGSVVIYDRENHRAWIQSTTTVTLDTTA